MLKSKGVYSFLFFVILLTSCIEDTDPLNPLDDRDAFLGVWNVTETCNRIPYQVTIIKDPSNSSQVIIKNFWLIGPNEKAPYAIVAGSSIVIPQQYINNDENTEVKGSGVLNKETIEWEYTANDGADLWTCVATYKRI